MTTRQPKWKLLANLGDVNPIDYGGYFVYQDTTEVYPPEAELLISPDSDAGTWTVYRFVLDRMEEYELPDGRIILIPFGFSKRSDLPFPIENYGEWFSQDLDQVAEFIGTTADQLRSMFCSPEPTDRAMAYLAIAEYHGHENLDSGTTVHGDFIALADAIREHNASVVNDATKHPFTYDQMLTLANTMAHEDPRFLRHRWMSYIAGQCGPNGGKAV